MDGKATEIRIYANVRSMCDKASAEQSAFQDAYHNLAQRQNNYKLHFGALALCAATALGAGLIDDSHAKTRVRQASGLVAIAAGSAFVQKNRTIYLSIKINEARTESDNAGERWRRYMDLAKEYETKFGIKPAGR